MVDIKVIGNIKELAFLRMKAINGSNTKFRGFQIVGLKY